MTPLDPSQQIRIEIPHKMTCLPAPNLFSDPKWWLKRSKQRATEDMTSVGTEDICRHVGGIWEVGGIWRPSESGGPFSTCIGKDRKAQKHVSAFLCHCQFSSLLQSLISYVSALAFCLSSLLLEMCCGTNQNCVWFCHFSTLFSSMSWKSTKKTSKKLTKIF